MRIEELRNLIFEYDHTWYLRKMLYGDHKEVTILKNHLNNLVHLPDQYELSLNELYELTKMIKYNSTLNVICKIRFLFEAPVLELNLMLENLGSANLDNFIKIYQMSNHNKNGLYQLLSTTRPFNTYNLLLSLKGEIRQEVINTILNLYQKDGPLSLIKPLSELLSILKEYNLFNTKVLNCLNENREHIIPLVKIIAILKGLHLLNTQNIRIAGNSQNLNKLAKILTISIKSSDMLINQELLETLLSNSDKIFYMDKLVSLLSKAKCLNNKNITLILNVQVIYFIQILSLLKVLNEKHILDSAMFQFIYSIANDYNSISCLNTLTKYNLFNKDIIEHLANKNLTQLDSAICYLENNKLASFSTINETLQMFLHGGIQELLALLKCFEKSGIKITEDNLVLFCSGKRQKKIIKLFNDYAAVEKLANNENLYNLLSLPESHFESIYQFIANNNFILCQEALDETLKTIRSQSPIASDQTDTKLKKLSFFITSHQLSNTTQRSKESKDSHTAIEVLTKNFYTYSQDIIEGYYLQPLLRDNNNCLLSRKIKINLKDGVLEREVHGGMHAGRVQFYTKILHEKMKEMFPNYTQEMIARLTNALGLNEEELLILTRYAALFHDSARENEFNDIWDEKSAQNCYEFLTEKGLSPYLAKIFSMAAAYKDKPQKYNAYLLEQNIDEEDIQYYHYIRKLIFMADCFDIMRCVSVFNIQRIFAELASIDEYNSSIHDAIVIEMAEEFRKLIFDQKDMLFACRIMLPNKSGFIPSEKIFSSYNLHTKVGFEHAENTCSVLGQSIKEHTYFAPYIANERLSTTRQAQVVPAFNPYIHGTNSIVFSLLERTHLSMLSPVEMLELYGIAPLNGEISGGGLSTISARSNTCFGRLNAKGANVYTLNKIIRGYTKSESQLPTETKAKARRYVGNSLKTAFRDINIMLIYLARAKQQGIDTLSKEESNVLVKELNATIQFYYLILLLGSKINPNFELLNKYSKETQDDFSDAVYTHLTFENLINTIIHSAIDLKEIYHNPTQDNLQKVLTLLSLPKESIIRSGFAGIPKAVNLPETELFSLNQGTDSSKSSYDDPHTYFGYMVQNSPSYSINSLLEKFIQGQITPAFFSALESAILKHLKILGDKAELLTRILNIKPEAMKFTERETYFLNHSFPMILLCEAEEKIALIDFGTQEYRTKEPLQIGTDIKLIATDTDAHRLAIMKFLEKNHIYNTKVVLFHQLFISQIDAKSPQSPYSHKDGFPLLSWLAAKNVPDRVETRDKATKEKISAGQYYRNIHF